jgi:hypothetical protein
MLGPLPYLHRLLLVLVALLVCTGIGVWLGLLPTFPVDPSLGALLGLAAGAGAAYLLVHDFHHTPA